VTEEQLARLRRWAAALAASGGGEREAAGRTIQSLADRVERLRQGELEYLDRLLLSEAKRLARQLSSGKGPPARRSAARAITLLVEEHERLARPAAELAPAWPASNGANDSAKATLNGAGNGNGSGDGSGGPIVVERPNGAPPALLAPRRMPLPEHRQAWQPPPREPDSGGAGARFGGMLPSGRAVRRVFYWAIGAAIVVGTFVYAPRLAAPDIEVSGPTSERIGMRDADILTFAVNSPAVASASWSLDGRTVEKGVKRQGATSTYRAVALHEGSHEVAVEVPGPIPGATAKHEWTFEIDLTPPTVQLVESAGRANWGDAVTIAGTVSEDATVQVVGRPAPVEKRSFSLRFAAPPRAGSVVVAATDTAGNVGRQRLALNIIPRRPPAPVRGVHVTFLAWKFPALRARILELVDAGKVSVVELDLKDESGVVGFGPDIPFGERMGAVHAIYDLEKAVRLLHGKGVRVVGRLVAFRDPIHAAAAYKAGRKNEVVQTPDGKPYAGYGGFTNFANPAVRKYNIDVAKAAVAAGVDEILYDYIRRPDGPRSTMRFPGLDGPAARSIADFLRETRQALPRRVFIGASVFGVAASRPQDVAQNVPMMAREVDYIAPLLYPSHWTADEYGVANPNAQPYDIVYASLQEFQKQVRGTGARLVPWLQDFSLGYTYGREEVQAQLQAAKELGVEEWILWNAEARYTSDALDRRTAVETP
jgi:hypothetical protein